MATFNDTLRAGGTVKGPLVVKPRSTSEVPLTVDGLAASGASDILLRVRNSAGTVLFSVDNTGNLSFAGSGTITIDQTITGNLTVNGNSTLGNSTSQDTLTVNAAATLAGTTTMTGLATLNNLLRFGSNGTITAGNYEIGRNGNAHLQYNVPLTQQHIFTVEDTAKLSISSTTVSINDNVVIGGTTTINGTLVVSGSISTFSSVRFADGSVSAPSISFTNDTDTGFYRVSSGLIGFAINGYQGMSLGLDATFGTMLKLKDNTGTPLEFHIGNFAAAAAFPRTYFLGGQDATDTNWAIRFAHKNSSSSAEIPVAMQISTNGDTSYTNADSLVLFAGTTYSYIDTGSGSASNGQPLYIGTSDASPTANAILISTVANGQSVSLVHTAVTSGAPLGFKVIGPAHTGLTASTEVPGIDFDLDATKQWATGALATQREVVVRAPTYGFVGASTLTTAVTFEVTGAPIAGTNATITNAYAARIGGNTTQVSAAAFEYSAISVPDHTLTLTGTTQLTNTPGIETVHIGQLTVTDGSAITVDHAATLHVDSAPTTSGSVTITKSVAVGIGGQGSLHPSSAGFLYRGLELQTDTVTLTGTTQVTSAGPAQLAINILTITDGSAVTINSAASLYVAGAVAQAGSVTITDKYAVWVDGGMSRFDGPIQITSNASAPPTGIGAEIQYDGTQVLWRGINRTSATSLPFHIAVSQFVLRTDDTSTVATIMTTDSGGQGYMTFQAQAGTSGSPTVFTVTGPAHTGLATTAEDIGLNLNFSATKTWAAGLVATQREVLVQAPTYATATFTNAATFAVSGAPSGTITNAFSIWSQGGTVRVDNSGGTTDALQVIVNSSANKYGINISGTGPTGQEMCKITNSATGGIAGFVMSGDTNINSAFGQAGSTVSAPFANNFSFYTGTTGTAGILFAIRQTTGTYSFYTGGTAAGNLALSISNGGNFTLLQQVATSGSPTGFLFTGGAHTTLTASTEAIDVNFNLARTVQFATGALANQRAMFIQAPTYGFVAASTLTTATTLELGGAPTEGTNATITFSRAMVIQDTAHTASNGYGLAIEGSGIANGAGAMTTIVDLGIGGSPFSVSLGNETSTLTNLYRIFVDTDDYASTTNVRTVSNVGGASFSAPSVVAGSALVTMQNIAGVRIDNDAHEYPSLAALNYKGLDVGTGTITVTGTTGMTATVGVSGVNIGIITVTDASVATMNAAASLYIEGAVAQAGSLTITNKYAVWVDAGAVRFDGNFLASGTIVEDGTTTSSGAGAVGITGSIHEITTTGTGDALTLANGTEGQRLSIIYVAEGAGTDTAVLTPTSMGGGTTVTFSVVGQRADGVFTNGKWYFIAQGAVIA